MTRLFHTVVLLLLALTSGAQELHALEIPPKPTAWVTDQAGIISSAEEQALNEKLEAFARRSGSQFLVYTFPTIGEEVIEDYTIRVAEQWKVRDDRAIIIFVFVAERKVRIEVGYGLEGAVPDLYARRVISDHITPRFRTGDYGAGLRAGVDALIARVEGKEAPIPHDVPAQRGPGGGMQPITINPLILFAIIIVFFVFIAPLMRRNGCGCGGCIPIPLFFPGGGGITYGGGGFGGGGGGGGGWSVGGSWGGGGGGSFGGGGATGGW